ncbi:Sister chromatid cohesion 1 protein 1 [Cardamine amara subsp. amara]|uniref:Sister chromatid cohesion 1 protein 1 n=1 Tax=Cardamine amara subsp. amara TaxID=228776 RepID=A0ABD0ZQW6_CARAN
MFYSHQLLARKAPLGQIWMAATLHAKINRKKLDKLDIIQICEEILNPSVPMALRLSGILMGGVVIVYERKVKLLFDDVNRFLVEINGAWRTKTVPDPTLLPKGRTHARKEAVTLPENEEADFGDFEQTRNIPKFSMDFQQAYISMRLDESDVNNNPVPEDLGQQFHQADAENITLFEYHGSYQTNNETYDRFERFDIEGDDETQTNFNPREGAEIPPTLIPSPPHHDIPQGGNPTSRQRQEQQDGRSVFAEQMEEQNIQDREEHDRPQPAKKRARKTATSMMDYEQTIITGHDYQSWLQDASHILCRGEKRKARGTISPGMKFIKRVNMPPTQLFEKHAESSYPPQLHELWSKSIQPLQTSTSETRHPDFCGEQSPGFVQEGMQNHHQTNHHQGSDISSKNLGSPAERLRTIRTGKDASIESMMGGSRASPENNNRQAADINVTPFYSGDDVRSMPSTPSARGAASINNIEISSKRSNRKWPNSSPRRGLEPVAEERPWEHRDYDFESSMLPEKGFTADNEVLLETGPTQTQNPVFNQSEEKITDSIKSHLKTHFETPGAAQMESLNKLSAGMDRNAAAQLFYQSCVLATRGIIKVNQTLPYGDILIARGPNM